MPRIGNLLPQSRTRAPPVSASTARRDYLQSIHVTRISFAMWASFTDRSKRLAAVW